MICDTPNSEFTEEQQNAIKLKERSIYMKY